MTRKQMASQVAEDLPRRLRRLRGRNTLEEWARKLGVEEMTCPACGGTGWLDRSTLWRCPLCYCTRAVPRAVGEWFMAEMRRRRQGLGERDEPLTDRTVDGAGGRRGRMAEETHAVHCRTPSARGL